MNVKMSFKIFLLVLGFVPLLIACIMFPGNLQFTVNAERTEGQVVSMSRMRNIRMIRKTASGGRTLRPVVAFETQDGREITFISSFGSNPPKYSPGDTVSVLYLPDNPEEAEINDFFAIWGHIIIPSIMGSVIFGFALIILLVPYFADKKEAKFRENGLRVSAEVSGIECNENMAVLNSHPYVIRAFWNNPETGEEYLFTSRKIWFDPKEFIEDGKVTVFIDKSDRSKYCMDLSFLPKTAPEKPR
jgi:hypothetical protein